MGMDQSFSFTRFGLLGSFLGGSFLGDFLGSNLFGSSLFGSGLFGNLFAFWGSSGLSGSSTSFDGLIALLEAIVSGLEGGVDGGGSSFAGRLSSLQGFSHSSGFLCHSINFKIRLYPDCSCITLIALTLNSNISSISSV